jgi:hypothetical protein
MVVGCYLREGGDFKNFFIFLFRNWLGFIINQKEKLLTSLRQELRGGFRGSRERIDKLTFEAHFHA